MLYEILLLASACPQAPPVGETSVELRFKRHRAWDFELLEESFRPVGSGFRFQGVDAFFKAEMEGQNLLVDLDGDGATDAKIEAPEEPGDESNVLLRTEAGFRYAARVRQRGGSWEWSVGCARTGRLGTSQITVIDANSNGIFNEVGVDALILGRGAIAHLLSETIAVDGELQSLRVEADGSRLHLQTYEGTTGRLDVRTGLKTEAKVLSAVLQSVDGRHCFDLARAAEGQQVPVGTYKLLGGKMGLANLEVAIGPGSSTRMEVASEKDVELVWGGPVKAEFNYQRSGSEVSFSPDQVYYYGKGGEEYTKWWPVGKSPVFTISNQNTKQEVARAMFPGSC